MIVTTAQLFKVAYGKFAIGAYNINNAEQAMGLFKGASQSQAPFIIQISKGARKYTDKRMLEAIIRAAGEIFPEAIFAVHLDHGDEKTCYDCIDCGFYSSVMIDASHEPFEKNVAITKRVVDRAHAKGISRRGRTRHARRRRGGHQGRRRQRLPDQPRRGRGFVKQTGCDSLACRHRHQPRRLQVQGPAVAPLRRDRGIQKLIPGFPHRHARQLQRAAGRSQAHQRGRRQARPSALRRRTRTNTSPPPSSASPRSTSTPTAAWSGPASIANFSATTPSEFDFRPPGKIFIEEYAKFIASRTSSSAPPASCPTCGRASGK